MINIERRNFAKTFFHHSFTNHWANGWWSVGSGQAWFILSDYFFNFFHLVHRLTTWCMRRMLLMLVMSFEWLLNVAISYTICLCLGFWLKSLSFHERTNNNNNTLMSNTNSMRVEQYKKYSSLIIISFNWILWIWSDDEAPRFVLESIHDMFSSPFPNVFIVICFGAT